MFFKGFLVCGSKNKREDPGDLGDPTFTKQNKQPTFPHTIAAPDWI